MREKPSDSYRRLGLSEHFLMDIPELDVAHAELIDILVAAQAPGVDQQAISDSLLRFSELYAAHCRIEEIHLRSAGYDRLSEHVAKHRAFARQINECREAFNADQSADRKIIEALCQAFMEHMVYDLQYKSHLDHARGR